MSKNDNNAQATISLERSSREELVDFIKKQALHIKKLENVCQKLKKDNAETTAKMNNLDEEKTQQKQMSINIINGMQEEINTLKREREQLDEQTEARFQMERNIYIEESKNLQAKLLDHQSKLQQQQTIIDNLKNATSSMKENSDNLSAVIKENDNLQLKLVELQSIIDQLNIEKKENNSNNNNEQEKVKVKEVEEEDDDDDEEEEEENEVQIMERRNKMMEEYKRLSKEKEKEQEEKEQELNERLAEINKDYMSDYSKFMEEKENTIEFLNSQRVEIEQLLQQYSKEMDELKLEVSSKSEEIATLTQRRDTNQSDIVKLRDDIEKLNEQLTDRDTIIKRLEVDANDQQQSHKLEIDTMNNEIIKLQSELKEQQQQQEQQHLQQQQQQDGNQQDQDDNIDNDRIIRLEEELKEKNSQLVRLESEVVKLDDLNLKVSELDTEIKHKDGEITRLLEEISLKSEDIKKLHQEIENQNNSIQQQQQQQQQQDNNNNNTITNQLIEKDNEIERINSLIANKDEELQRVNNQLDEKSGLLEIRDKEIVTLTICVNESKALIEKTLESCKVEILEKENALQATTAELSEIRVELEQKTSEIEQMQRDLGEKDNAIRSQSNKNDIKVEDEKRLNEKVLKLKNLLVAAQKHVSDLKKQIADKTQELQDKTGELAVATDRVKQLESNRDEVESNHSEYLEMKRNYSFNLQRIQFLDGQLSSATQSLKAIQEEFDDYKVKVHHALKQQQSTEQVEQDGDDDQQQSAANAAAEMEAALAKQQQHFQTEKEQDRETIIKLEASISTIQRESLVELEKLQSELSEKQEKIDQLSLQITELSQTVQQLNDRLDSTTVSSDSNNDSQSQQQQTNDLEKELKLREERIIEIQSQLNFFKRNNNSLMREKDRLIEEQRQSISKLKEELETLKLNNNNNNNNEKPKLQSPIQPLNSTVNTPQLIENESSQSIDIEQGNNFSIEHLLPTTNTTPKEDSFKSIELPQSLPLEVEKILHSYARTQANRDEELRKSKIQIDQLKMLLNESDRMEQKHFEQEKLLKEEIRNLERCKTREGSNLEYFIEKDDESLIPVLSTLMQFTPDELNRATTAQKSKKSNGSLWGWGSSYFTPTK
ncbi:hypothetical protein PPL_03417 [Heterostelium album PN500]|uniref:GRIP domain-containing protein n=1 Tax=Heterostelium pallidum (strain ATCC 26659 / Pp 5 / PN500) TaxID=670386 RepID=D3B4U1_HETP5|nr:hypothetical protein PPL_03417 [Heterostelium album PN500]EFA84339.1 hypothetical protein PPL_03417 [Heterostelium album PN500]|eukprot:XP_020436454.1 hypothetical protein PPL_03417 [Heterostelium album PN500]